MMRPHAHHPFTLALGCFISWWIHLLATAYILIEVLHVAMPDPQIFTLTPASPIEGFTTALVLLLHPLLLFQEAMASRLGTTLETAQVIFMLSQLCVNALLWALAGTGGALLLSRIPLPVRRRAPERAQSRKG